MQKLHAEFSSKVVSGSVRPGLSGGYPEIRIARRRLLGQKHSVGGILEASRHTVTAC